METNFETNERNEQQPVNYNDLPGREMPERRGRATKHFDLGQGRYQAIVYPHAVHYQDEDGGWQEIDNTLTLTTDEQGREFYVNAHNPMGMKLAVIADNALPLIALEKGNNKLSWKLRHARRVRGVPVMLPDEQPSSELEARTSLGKQRTCIEYPGIFPGATLRVALDGEMITDDIVFSTPEAARQPVEFEITASGLALSEENGDLKLIEPDTEEVAFFLPKPTAWDSDANTLDIPVERTVESPEEDGQPLASMSLSGMHVSGDLTAEDGNDSGETTWCLTYQMDEAILEDAQWPVTLDPAVYVSKDSATIEHAYVSSGAAGTSYANTTLCKTGYVSGTGTYRTYLKVSNVDLGGFNESHRMLYAGLCALPKNALSTVYVHAKEVLASWSPSTLTWSNQPTEDNIGRSIDFINTTSTSSFCSWDITNHFRGWYKGTLSNFGLRLENDATTADYIEYNSPSTTNGANRMYIVVNYVSSVGLEDWWDYEGLSAERAGTAQVNLATGNLVVTHADISASGNRMPISIAHHYNLCDRLNYDLHCGYGWRLSVYQTLHYTTIANLSGGTDTWYVYTDGDGTQHFFKKSGTGPWSDESGLQLKLSEIAGNLCTITDLGDGVMTFPKPTAANTKTMIQSIKDSNGNAASFTYFSDGRIWKITDGAKRETLFTYGAANANVPALNYRLISITAPGPVKTEYEYDAVGNLQTITYPDGLVSTYSYSGTRLTEMKAPSGLRVKIAYNAAFGNAPCTVASLEELSATMLGAKRLFSYGDVTTDVTSVSSRSTDAGTVTTYQFNDAGNTVSVKDPFGYANFSKFTGSAPINHADEVSKTQKVVVNLLSNHSFEKNANWTPTTSGGSNSNTTAEIYSTEQAYMGGRSLKLNKTNADGALYALQINTLTKGKTYTLSAWVKTAGMTATQTGGAYVAALYTDTTGNKVVRSAPILQNQSEWQRLQVSFTIPASSGSASVQARLYMEGTVGKAYFDCVQLEEGPIASRYNMLENACFTRFNASNAPDDWVANSSVETATDVVVDAQGGLPSNLPAKAYQFTGKPSLWKTIEQELPIPGIAGDSFAFGGWANGCSAPTKNKLERFRIGLSFKKPDGSYVGLSVADFNNEWVDWQYATASATADVNYVGLKVRVDYCTNVNTAQFTGLMLHKEQYGEKYIYDMVGNIAATRGLTGASDKREYNANRDLIAYTRAGTLANLKSKYTYDDGSLVTKSHNLTTEETPKGIQTEYKYDAFGNVRETITQDDTTSPMLMMKTSATYQSETVSGAGDGGNFVSTETDERGKVTTYDYDRKTGQLKTITDPKGQVLTNTYDSMGRLTKVVMTDTTQIPAKEYANSYTYENDILKAVEHNGFDYTLDYDSLDRVTSIKAAESALVTYTYTADRIGEVSKVTYGNGQIEANTYDDLGQLVSVTVDKETSPRYHYEYGINGMIGMSKDAVLGTLTMYEYDSADRDVKEEKRDAQSGERIHKFDIAYDAESRISQLSETVADLAAHTTNYLYDQDGNIISMQYDANTSNTLTYGYDGLGRISKRIIGLATAPKYTSTYSFIAGSGSGTTTPILASISQPGQNVSYTYDNVGNIATETRNGKVSKYTYDGIGQLIRHDDQAGNVSWTYGYDTAGNILEKKRFAYTTGTLGTAAETIPYAYKTTGWKDVMTSYNGASVTYGASGNLANDGTWAYNWDMGRRLTKMEKTGTTIRYSYNEHGLRTRKELITGGVSTITDYTLRGGQVIHVKRGSLDMHIQYDADQKPTRILYGDLSYWYVHNQQGDIIALLDSSGVQVVEYGYDIWGVQLRCTGSLANTLGKDNPFRYRGYVADEETGFYYLQRRYYDPKISRFISADDPVATRLAGSHILCTNLFSYCLNNPEMYSDPTGYVVSPANVIGALIAGIIGAVGGYIITTLLADKIGLRGWGRQLFIWGLTAVITAAAATIGYFIGPYIARAAKAIINGLKRIIVKLLKSQCFVAGTLIKAKEGNVPIENIKVGDYVYSQNPETGENELKLVVETFVSETNSIISVCVGGELLEVTEGHPFWVVCKGWVTAQYLRVGDELLLANGDKSAITSVTVFCIESPTKVYNFEVADWHTYYVTANGVLVHNMCAKKSDIKMIDDVCKVLKINRNAARTYIHALKKQLHMGGAENFSWEELGRV